eukprot:gene32175-13703_t
MWKVGGVTDDDSFADHVNSCNVTYINPAYIDAVQALHAAGGRDAPAPTRWFVGKEVAWFEGKLLRRGVIAYIMPKSPSLEILAEDGTVHEIPTGATRGSPELEKMQWRMAKSELEEAAYVRVRLGKEKAPVRLVQRSVAQLLLDDDRHARASTHTVLQEIIRRRSERRAIVTEIRAAVPPALHAAVDWEDIVVGAADARRQSIDAWLREANTLEAATLLARFENMPRLGRDSIYREAFGRTDYTVYSVMYGIASSRLRNHAALRSMQEAELAKARGGGENKGGKDDTDEFAKAAARVDPRELHPDQYL